MKSPAHQKAFRIITSHPECLLDDEPLDPLIDEVAAAIEAECAKWRSLAVRLAKQHEPYVPMFPSDECRKRTISGALLDEIYALDALTNLLGKP